MNIVIRREMENDRFYSDAINGQQVVDELSPDDIFRLITAIPWGHNQRIIFKCKDLRGKLYAASVETPFNIRCVREVGYCFEMNKG